MTPSRVHANAARKTSVLFFPDSAEGREFYMRGAVCWPTLVDREDGSQDVQGYALMAGLEVATGFVQVFEETDFVTVEHILTPEQIIQHKGLAPWLNTNWSRYYGDTYFWRQGDELTRKYRLEVVRSPWCRPKPHFVEVEWQDEAEARQLVWRYVKLRRLGVARNGKLASAMQAAKMDKGAAAPALHALQCLLAGLERYPWRDMSRKQTPEREWERQSA